MDNNDVKTLVEAFKGYRDLLTPIQGNLHDFIDTYDALKDDIERLNNAFGGGASGSLDRIYQNLARQAEQAGDLSAKIDKFVGVSSKYTSEIAKLTATFDKLEDRLKAISQIEQEAEAQIGKLDAILEDKKKNYNVRELQKSLEQYQENVRKMTDFLNKDVSDRLAENQKTLNAVRTEQENMTKRLDEENRGLGSLIADFENQNAVLRKISDGQSVNEHYIFDILDKWAESRKVRAKKPKGEK